MVAAENISKASLVCWCSTGAVAPRLRTPAQARWPMAPFLGLCWLRVLQPARPSRFAVLRRPHVFGVHGSAHRWPIGPAPAAPFSAYLCVHDPHANRRLHWSAGHFAYKLVPDIVWSVRHPDLVHSSRGCRLAAAPIRSAKVSTWRHGERAYNSCRLLRKLSLHQALPPPRARHFPPAVASSPGVGTGLFIKLTHNATCHAKCR